MSAKPEQRERRPKGMGWIALRMHKVVPDPNILAESAWQSGAQRVISSLILADLPDRSGVGPQWHMSISRKGKRPKDVELRRALRAFDMVGAEEDNHHPGVARHFFRPVDPAHRVDCECKTDETVIIEKDGYTWTNPTDGPCRGCEFERRFGTPCPLHTEART